MLYDTKEYCYIDINTIKYNDIYTFINERFDLETMVKKQMPSCRTHHVSIYRNTRLLILKFSHFTEPLLLTLDADDHICDGEIEVVAAVGDNFAWDRENGKVETVDAVYVRNQFTNVIALSTNPIYQVLWKID